jgi:hypothetical protein
MNVGLTCFPGLPGRGDPSTDFSGCEGTNNLIIYDESCTIRGAYGIPDCGTPFVIEDNFLPYVLTMKTINTDVGDPYFSFLYGDGVYSIRNNHCVCVNDGSGLEAKVACRCAFPINGHFGG